MEKVKFDNGKYGIRVRGLFGDRFKILEYKWTWNGTRKFNESVTGCGPGSISLIVRGYGYLFDDCMGTEEEVDAFLKNIADRENKRRAIQDQQRPTSYTVEETK